MLYLLALIALLGGAGWYFRYSLFFWLLWVGCYISKQVTLENPTFLLWISTTPGMKWVMAKVIALKPDDLPKIPFNLVENMRERKEKGMPAHGKDYDERVADYWMYYRTTDPLPLEKFPNSQLEWDALKQTVIDHRYDPPQEIHIPISTNNEDYRVLKTFFDKFVTILSGETRDYVLFFEFYGKVHWCFPCRDEEMRTQMDEINYEGMKFSGNDVVWIQTGPWSRWIKSPPFVCLLDRRMFK